MVVDDNDSSFNCGGSSDDDNGSAGGSDEDDWVMVTGVMTMVMVTLILPYLSLIAQGHGNTTFPQH